MPAISRVTDQNQAGGQIQRGAESVKVNGLSVGVHPSPITPHGPYPRRGRNEHQAAVTTDGSPSVFAEGNPVLRVTSPNSCGHSISQGSPDVNVE